MLWGLRQFLISLFVNSCAHQTPEGTNILTILPEQCE